MLLRRVTLQMGVHNDLANRDVGRIVLPGSFSSPDDDCGEIVKYIQSGLWPELTARRSAATKETLQHKIRRETGETVLYIAALCYDRDWLGKDGTIPGFIDDLCATLNALPIPNDQSVGLILNPACVCRQAEEFVRMATRNFEGVTRGIVWFDR